MGLFVPKITPTQISQAKLLLKQSNESIKLVNTTTNPETYFGRLNFTFDVLLEMKKFEKYKIYTGKTPTQNYKMLIDELEKSADLFIKRSYEKQLKKISSLKTEKAKINSMKKYANNMIVAFQNANNYWLGNNQYPHYRGDLYTSNNLNYLTQLLKDYI